MHIDRGAAWLAAGFGVLLAGAILGIGRAISLFWVEVFLNLGAGVAIGAVYGRLAYRRGTVVENAQLARGGALCAVVPVTVLWWVAMGPPGIVAGLVIGPGLGAAGGALAGISV